MTVADASERQECERHHKTHSNQFCLGETGALPHCPLFTSPDQRKQVQNRHTLTGIFRHLMLDMQPFKSAARKTNGATRGCTTVSQSYSGMG